jgi:alkanesulfonate monooxygenase SsuD/methylene tetrahydromethanopterin reductase-like flavin-dependent oxidoreductase (luciferase family)
MFGMRFDLRNPAFAETTMTERVAACLEMAEWADEHGFVATVVSEHHGSEDGYLPSALMMAAAMAARTKNIRIQIALMVAPLYNPLQLAEDIAMLDHIAGGRASVAIGAGYAHHEFAMFDVPLDDRGPRMTETVETCLAAWSGEPFSYRGRTVRVTPKPATPGTSLLAMGGNSRPAARRAAKYGLSYIAPDEPAWEQYREEVIKTGAADPGPHFSATPGFLHLATDPDAGWDQIAPFAMHETNAYGEWLAEAGTERPYYKTADSAAALRESGAYRVLTPGQLVAELKAKGDLAFAVLHPMMGGIPPALAWESLHLLEKEVLPNL